MSRTPPKPPAPPQAPVPQPPSPEILEIDDIIAVDDPTEQPLQVPMPTVDVAPDLIDIDAPAPEMSPSDPIDLTDADLSGNVEPLNLDLPAPVPLLTPIPSTAPALDDLPAIPLDTGRAAAVDLGAPPSLMDDLPVESAGAQDQSIDLDMGLPSLATAIDSEDAGAHDPPGGSEALDLAALPDLNQPDDSLSDLPAAGLSSLDTGEPDSVEVPRPKGRKVAIVAAVGAVVLLLGGGAALYMSPLAVDWGLRSAPTAPKQVVAPKPVVTAAVPKPPPPVEAPKVVLEPLSLATIDHASYPSLMAGIQKLAGSRSGEAAGLLNWARWRLAYGFADSEAKTAALAILAEKPEAHPHALSAASQAATALLWGKPPQAKRALARLKGPLAQSPQAQFVLALAQTRKKMVPPKAMTLLEKLQSTAPEMVDARLLHAELLLARKNRSDGVRSLVELAHKKDPDVTVRACEALLRVEDYAGLSEAVAGLEDGSMIPQAAPAHQTEAWQWLIAQHVMQGDVAGALQVATARQHARPHDAMALIDMARLTTANGGDGARALTDNMGTMTDAEAKAQLYYEQVIRALQRKDDDALQVARKEVLTLPDAEAGGWAHMIEGVVAQSKNDLSAARAAYAAASKGRPNFEEPRGALLTLGSVKPDDVPALAKVIRKSPLPAVRYRYVEALEAKGDAAAAAHEMLALIWADPTYGDPVDTVMHWLDLVDRSGEALRAETVAETIANARPSDDRPPLQIIEMARRGKRYNSMIKWYGVLLNRHPNHRVYTVALANAYIDSNKNEQALKVLEALAKADPEARNEEFLFTEGRAWGANDVVRARGFLQASIKLKPHPRAYILLGELEQQRGKNDEALAAYRDALALDPNQPAVRLKLVKVLITKGFTREAVEELQTMLAKNPRDGEAAEMLGDALREQGDIAAAMGAYEKAVQVRTESPALAPLLLKMARLHLQELSQPALAVKELHRIIKLDAKLADAHYYLGYALRDAGKRGEARTELQAYLHLAPQGEFAKEVQQAIDDTDVR